MKRSLLAVLLLLQISCAGNPKPAAPLAPPPPAPAAQAPSQADYVKTTIQSIVRVTGTYIDEDGMPGGQYVCTGWAIAARKYMTAAHCVDGQELKVDGVAALLVKQDKEKDLAVLVADLVKPGLTIRTDLPHFMEALTGIGYGYGFHQPTITDHKVIMTHYSPDANIFPGLWVSGGFIGGMSGGPVIDKDGLVVMMVQRGSAQVGYGVPGQVIQDFIDAALEAE